MKHFTLSPLLATLIVCTIPLGSTAQTAGGETMGPHLPSGLNSTASSPAPATEPLIAESAVTPNSPANAAGLAGQGAATHGPNGGASRGPSSAVPHAASAAADRKTEASASPAIANTSDKSNSANSAAAQGSPAPASASSGSAYHAKAPAMRHVIVIEGMTCAESCPPKVRKALLSIKGVRSVEVDFKHKTAIVMTEQGAVLTKEICDKAFGNEGFFVSSLFSHPTTN